MSFNYPYMQLHVFLYLVYFLETIFGRGLNRSVLDSPIFSPMSKACLRFSYQISSPSIQLAVMEKTASNSDFKPIPQSGLPVLFSDQETVGSWNDVSVSLADDAIQFRIIAEKTRVSSNIHYAMIDFMQLTSCSDEGSGLITLLTILSNYSKGMQVALF